MNNREPAERSGEADDLIERLFRSSRFNAILAWLFIVPLLAIWVESALDVDYQWTVFVGAVAVIVLIPPVVYRDWQMMLPWELLLLALFPILVRGLFGGEVGTFAAYLSIAGLALIVTVELNRFTSLSVTHWFAVVLVVMTTMASVAAWTIVRWNLDRTVGTNYLTTNESLMMEWLWVTLAGVVAGLLFEAYFRRRDRQLRRLLSRVIRR
ncbi:MAG: hypothetical protein V5A38_11160 [Halolamina sp.]|uniref:hypothetical protein n=1 Tax=Halolamina sp. TaxID=1940283 RepID=UPI002FC381B1